ncbi:DUF7827 domain-containing protein [Halorussus litoreus]|uniref:DUF7827 domain-containing protein n=1 Tax=Halorussus litoreus TaxID=1710536 RepID=UPI0013004F2E|nr:BGTF surface domain-containing protein [Halorussus litoreus]
MTRTSLLLTTLLVVGAATAGLTGGVASSTDGVSEDATAVQMQIDGTAEVNLTSDDVFWQGQLMRFTASEDNASEVWAVRRVDDGELGGLVTELLLDGSGSATFSSTGLDGEYVVVDANDQPVVFEDGAAQRTGNVSDAAFEVAEQTLDASFEDGTVRNDDHPDARTDLRIASNRAGYGATLFSEGLSASELADVLSATEARDDRAVVTRNLSSDDILDANFTGVEPGTYNVTVVASDGTAQDTATITVTEPVEGSAALSNDTYEQQRGDVVRFDVTFDGTDTATVDLGSQDVGYHARFTVVDENGDGEATVEFDTYRAGQAENAPGISVAGEDSLSGAELVTDPIPGRLDAAAYSIEVSVGATRTAVGAVQLSERETGGMAVWTAPESVSVGNTDEIAESATQDDGVAYQDWAIVQVEASGLYAYLQNRSDLNNETTGLSMSLTRFGEINVPREQVPLDRGELIVDEANDQFFFVIPTNGLDEGASYQAQFNVTDANPYVEEGQGTSLSANFSVVERDVSFQEPIEVPASSDATISGSSSVAPGTDLEIEVSNTQDSPFLRRATATVGEDGSWEASFDLSEVEPGTNFTVDVAEPEANATGVVVGDGAGATETETTTETTTTTEAEQTETETTETTEAETTAEDEADGAAGDEETTATGDGEGDATDGDESGAGEETTAAEADEAGADEEDTADDEADAADGETTGEQVVAADDTTTADETTDEQAARAPASGLGPFAIGGALAVLGAVGMLALRRR